MPFRRQGEGDKHGLFFIMMTVGAAAVVFHIKGPENNFNQAVNEGGFDRDASALDNGQRRHQASWRMQCCSHKKRLARLACFIRTLSMRTVCPAGKRAATLEDANMDRRGRKTRDMAKGWGAPSWRPKAEGEDVDDEEEHGSGCWPM